MFPFFSPSILFERYRKEREGKIGASSQVTSQMSEMGAGPGQSHKPGTRRTSLLWKAGTQRLGASSASEQNELKVRIARGARIATHTFQSEIQCVKHHLNCFNWFT